MDFNFTPAEEAFRSELRHWLLDALPEGWGETVFEPEDEDERAMFRLAWEKKLFAGGWSGINWPIEYGGRGATLMERGIFAEEMARARAPEGLNIIGHNLVGSTLLRHGTEAQKQRFLPKIISSNEVWCQGFSEPNAGSDLASVRTKAERHGDHFVISGQKIWTSYAQYSDWCFALVRTDPAAPKHKGLSFLLIDMKSPGISIRPLRQISGECEFNETFFDEVEVPVENVVGEINGGWQIAMTTLAYERGPEDALGRQVQFKQELDTLIHALTDARHGEGRAIDVPEVRQKLGLSIIEVEVMRLNALRSFSKYQNGEERGADASVIKLFWSHAAQRMYEAAMDALGPTAPLSGSDRNSAAGGRFQLSWLQSKAFSIYSGSSEIQRNIIGERMLGLPGERGMNFGFDEQQRELGDTVAAALADMAALTAPDLEPIGHAEAWDSLAGLGLFALLVPEAQDGVGLSMVDLALSIEAVGAGLAPPLIASTLIATDLIGQFGSEAQKARHLPAIARGEVRIAIATVDGSGAMVRNGRLQGQKLLVSGASNADLLLVTAGDDRLLLVEARTEGVAIEPHDSLDPSAGLARVTFEQVELGNDFGLGGPNATDRLLDVAATVHAGMLCGIANRMLMTAVDYAKTREQFGKPIGSFQAIKHRCADMAVAVEAARSAAYYAFWAISERHPDAPRAASMAKAYCGEAARFVCNEAIQVHGGMGFTWELGLHRFLRRSKLFQHSFGDTAFHQERVVAATLASTASPATAHRDAA